MVFYFTIIKYNWTEESFSPTIMEWSFVAILGSAVLLNLFTLVVSIITYGLIVFLMQQLFKRPSHLSLILTGFTLTLTTPIFYRMLTSWKHNDYYMIKAETIAWILCFIVSISTYYIFNKWSLKEENTNSPNEIK